MPDIFPLVSVIIPTYNAENYIEKTIRSVQQLAYPSFEIVVVDDCSKDRTLDVCRKLGSGIKIVSLKKNYGGSYARNQGAFLAKGDYYIFFDADDEMFPERISKQLEVMKIQGSGISYCQAIDEIGNVLGSSGGNEFISNLLSSEIDIVSTSGLMMTKEIFNAVEGFDDSFRRQQDIEFIIRVAEIESPVFIKKPLYRKINSGSPSYDNVKQGRNAVFSKYSTILSGLSPRSRRKIYAVYHIRLAELSFRETRSVFFMHVFFALYFNPLVFLNRFVRYRRKINRFINRN
jgi:glycosyltransferase involved in cell wall biosynthesis